MVRRPKTRRNLEYAVGVGLAFGVAVFAALSGFDKDRAFYLTMLVVIATYYDLFAVIGVRATALGRFPIKWNPVDRRKRPNSKSLL